MSWIGEFNRQGVEETYVEVALRKKIYIVELIVISQNKMHQNTSLEQISLGVLSTRCILEWRILHHNSQIFAFKLMKYLRY
jgi:hypothetical protein